MDSLDPSPTTDDALWQAVLDRDARQDGAFVYAVRSTGVFCRPSCPSRRARRAQVEFFATPAAAVAAGFRACKRCQPLATDRMSPHVGAVDRVCRAIEERDEGPPTLAELGAQVSLSPYHLQRVFKALTGVSPMQYAQAVRLGRLKRFLRNGEPVAEALYGAGYGSSSRLYEKAPAHLGMTPASYAKGGKGAHIAFTVADPPLPDALGRLLIGITQRGICMVAFGKSDVALEVELRREYPLAMIHRDDAALGDWVRIILGLIEGNHPHADLPLDIRATAFQWQVWTRLQAIPRGETLSYREIAIELGLPKGARAVGRACAGNPVSLIVPCHRAVASDGAIRGYRWGIERKKALLMRERGEG